MNLATPDIGEEALLMKYLFIILILLCTNALATQMTKVIIDDPILDNEKCEINTILSMGSYIFHYPSKYDQIFFPDDSLQGVSVCEKSGFIAFNDDFENLTKQEKSDIHKYLNKSKFKLGLENEYGCVNDEVKLQHLEKIYSFRKKSQKFKFRLNRVLAYLYDVRNLHEKANGYRTIAFEQLPQLLSSATETLDKLKYLYIGTSYSKQLKLVEQHARYQQQLLALLNKDIPEDAQGFANYISKLSEDTVNIEPLGTLRPSMDKPSKIITNNRKLDKTIYKKSPEQCHSHLDELIGQCERHFNRVRKSQFKKSIAFRKKIIETGNISLLNEFDSKYIRFQIDWFVDSVEYSKSNLKFLEELKESITFNTMMQTHCSYMNPTYLKLDKLILSFKEKARR
ncbi:hypothetical protein [Algibacillus agarilyticus]|uniref:hypothetical protein n=1 Tax=Algibacillus agarilyticus TaxID=2234133 RepID=UPI0013006376|nr:hypothetical protein [Algibacillus agarilyticus]